MRQEAVCEGGEGLQCRSMMVGMKFLVVVFWADGSPALTVNATRGWGPGPGGRGLTRLGAGKKKGGFPKISEASKKSAVAGQGLGITIQSESMALYVYDIGAALSRPDQSQERHRPFRAPWISAPIPLIYSVFSPHPLPFSFSYHVYIVPAVSRVSFPSRAACSIIHGPSITHPQQGKIPAQSHGGSSRRLFFLSKTQF